MKILVTGGSGQLGLSLNAVRKDYPAHTFAFTDIPETDITDEESVQRAIEKYDPDIIVNCAAYTAVDRAEEDSDAAYRINSDGAGILAALARECGIKLIHISTDYVFDGKACNPLTEESPVNPESVYGKSKFEGEEKIRISGCDAAVIRTAWLYSEYGSNFVKTMLRLAETRDSINVVSDQTGNPTYAADLAHAVIKVAEDDISGYEIYNFSGGGVATWNDFAREIFALANVSMQVNPIATEDYPAKAPRPQYSVLLKDKIKSLGVAVPYWKDSLRVCLRNMGYVIHD